MTWPVEWGTPWQGGSTVDHDANARARGRRIPMLDLLGYRALVRVVGRALDDVETDAWAVLHHCTPGTSFGASLDADGADLGFPRPSLLWDDTYYRRVLGAWLCCQSGLKTVAGLDALIEALAANGEDWTIVEYPNHVWIHVTGITDDTATLWAQVIEAARTKGVLFWLSWSPSPDPFTLDESLLDGPDFLVGLIELGA